MDIKQLNEELEKILNEYLDPSRYKRQSKNYDFEDIKKYAKTFKLISARKKDIFNNLKYDLHVTKMDNGHYCFWLNDNSTGVLEVESLRDIIKFYEETETWGLNRPKYVPELEEAAFDQVCPARK